MMQSPKKAGMILISGFSLICGLGTGSRANAAVTIATFENKSIAQRVSRTGNFAASGTYTGNPAGIQVRIVKSEDGTEALAWQKAKLVLASKEWNANLTAIPEGGWYRVEVREQGQTAAIQSANQFGVGVILVMMGQSNMEGFCKEWGPSDKTIEPHPLTSHMKYYGYKWYTPTTRPDSGLPVILLANNLVKALGIPVGIISIPAGSSTINEWLGDTVKTHRSLPGLMRKAFRYAGGDVEAICWHQGYSDFGIAPGATLTPEAVKTMVWNEGWGDYEEKLAAGLGQRIPYYTKLTRLYDMAKKEVRRDNLLFFVGVKGRSLSGKHVESRIDGIPQSPRVDCVRWAQMSWAKDHPNGHLLGHAMDMRMEDMAHERPRDRFTLAARWTQSILSALGKATFNGAGASFIPGQCGFSDGGILLRVKHEGGNQLSMPFPGKPVEGFLVRQPGKKAPIEIKRVILRQPNSVHLELINPPKGDLLVAYLAGPLPISDPSPAKPRPEPDRDDVPGNILFDNAELPSGNFRPGNMVQPSLGWIRISTPSATKPFGSTPSRMRLTVSPSMRIGFSLKQKSQVSLRLYDVRGKRSWHLVNEMKAAGTHSVGSLPRALPNGFYVADLRTGSDVLRQKVVVLQ